VIRMRVPRLQAHPPPVDCALIRGQGQIEPSVEFRASRGGSRSRSFAREGTPPSDVLRRESGNCLGAGETSVYFRKLTPNGARCTVGNLHAQFRQVLEQMRRRS